ncbi:dynamin family protein [Gordonia caeni]|uniref:Dynamin-like GTPase family protein n=1 Tax=Gordonia caeni TaxID=1007097 RepID=A0ABP7NUE4_9ACTN
MAGNTDAVLMDAVRGLLRDVAATVPARERPAVEAVTSRVFGAPTVALAGRVSSGKSTLANALIGQQIAPTDQRECTRVATLYEFGVPERAELVGLDGARHERPAFGSRELGCPPEDVDFEVVHLAQAPLRDRYRIIDTPGLTGHTTSSERATRRALIDGHGLPAPDAVLFLVEGGRLRTDEVSFLQDLGASPRNTMLVSSQADTAGEGAAGDVDPFDVAAQHAAVLAREFAHFTQLVVPVSGLMAEAAELGISEREAAALSSLAGIDRDELLLAIHAGETSPEIAGLLERIGLYGLLHGRNRARAGAVAMSDWLLDRSGLVTLRRAIDTVLRRASSVGRARVAVAGVRELAGRSAARDAVAALLERFELAPAAHRLRETAVADRLRRREPDSPVLARLAAVLAADGPAAVCGLPPSASPAQITSRAAALLTDCRAQRIAVLSSAEREALTVLERTYQLAAEGGSR